MAYTPGRHNLPLITWSGVFVFFFLLIFRPFEIEKLNENQLIRYSILVGYGVITSFSVYFFTEILGRIWQDVFSEENWKVKNEVLFVVCLISFITLLNYFYTLLVSPLDFSFSSFILISFATIALSFFPAVAFVWFRYYRDFKKYSVNIELHQPTVVAEEQPIAVHWVNLTAENGKDKLEFLAENLLYIQASDNYCSVFYLDNCIVKKVLIRNTLGRIETQISVSFIKRCHRSYLINLDKVTRVSGNSQGYKLHLLNDPTVIPVSKGYVQVIEPFVA